MLVWWRMGVFLEEEVERFWVKERERADSGGFGGCYLGWMF